VTYTEKNIDEQPEYIDYLLSKGFQAVPVLESEKTTFSGFRPTELNQLLA
jgi:glutaredoxin-like protein NrdH